MDESFLFRSLLRSRSFSLSGRNMAWDGLELMEVRGLEGERRRRPTKRCLSSFLSPASLVRIRFVTD